MAPLHRFLPCLPILLRMELVTSPSNLRQRNNLITCLPLWLIVLQQLQVSIHRMQLEYFPIKVNTFITNLYFRRLSSLIFLRLSDLTLRTVSSIIVTHSDTFSFCAFFLSKSFLS